MDRRLLEAATSGDVPSMKQLLALDGPGVLLGTTPQGNTCLHIASIQDHEDFCKNILTLDHSPAPVLLSTVNKDGETPLLTAVARGCASLASVLLRYCRYQQLSEIILKQDKHGCNVLHHAIRRGHRMLALELIEAVPTLSKAVDSRNKSPLFIAAVRNFTEVFHKLLEIPDSSDSGAFGFNVLHGAVRNENIAIVRRIMEMRPWLARQESEDKYTPMHLAAYQNKVDVLTVLLEHDPFLGYLISTYGFPLLCIAASKGHVGVARELLKHCPDAPYCDANGLTCLHVAVLNGQAEFVEYVLGSQQLHHRINMADNSGETALHLAWRRGLTWIASVLGDGEKNINSNPASVSSSEGTPMDGRVLEAAVTGDARLIKDLDSHNPSVLLGTTQQGNTCLHIASIHGHHGFCKDVLTLSQSLPLLNAINANGETPLLTAVARGHATLASVLLRFCCDQQLSETILKQDKRGFNALHHAIFRGYRKLALELIEAEPALSKAVNKCYESPMFIAVTRDYGDVLEKLLQIPDAAHGGAYGYNALHAAVTSGNAVMAKRVMEARPWLVRQGNEEKRTPMYLAAIENKIDVLRVLLEHDPSLGYFISTDGDGAPLLCIAASEGNVGVARELLRHCPDPPYFDAMGSTCLHIAISFGQEDFVRFVARSPQLQHLMNLPNDTGETALQLADRITSAGEERKRQTMMSMVAVLQLYLSNLSIHAEPFTSGMERPMEVAVSGHVAEMRHLCLHVPGVLGTTAQGNTCLHIAAIHGHEVFCKEVLALNPSLLTAINSDGETPLLAAVASGCLSVASVLLRCCRDQQLSGAILKQDKRGCNALHHAIRNGHRKLALELIQAEPALSHYVNQYGESPMFIAVMRKYEDVFDKLFEIRDSAHGGADGMNALHASVWNGNSAIANKIMEARPWLAREEDKSSNTPMHLAVRWHKIDVLSVLLEHDRSLGYQVSSLGNPLLVSAAYRGHVDVARELLKHCPDAPCYNTRGSTCLHIAVQSQQTEFVKFVLGLPQLQKLVNMRDENGDTALHVAVQKCDPKMVAALLLHRDIDIAVVNNNGYPVNRTLPTDRAKTLNWEQGALLSDCRSSVLPAAGKEGA